MKLELAPLPVPTPCDKCFAYGRRPLPPLYIHYTYTMYKRVWISGQETRGGEERKVDMEAAVPRGRRKIKRERERDRKEERDDVYIYTPLGTELSSTRTMSSGCLLETFQTKRRQSRNLGWVVVVVVVVVPADPPLGIVPGRLGIDDKIPGEKKEQKNSLQFLRREIINLIEYT